MDIRENVVPMVTDKEKEELTRAFKRELRQAALVAGGALVLGLIPILVYAAQAKGPGSVLSIGLLAAFASSLVGALAGLLFGIPRGSQEDAPSLPEGQPGATAKAKTGSAVNTNLVQVSDWLVKIIVGVTLIEFKGIRAAFGDTAAQLGAALGGGNTAAAVAAALLIYFSIFGFLTAYVSARLLLPREFSIAEAIAAVEVKAQQRARESVTRIESEVKEMRAWRGHVDSALGKVREQIRAEVANAAARQVALGGPGTPEKGGIG